jgi:SAM-dependent methyltransferase
MRVRRNFNRIYSTQDDPWAIGEADAERYDVYREMILEHATARGSMLDVGSSLGAFLARFRDDFGELCAVDVSARAVEVGRERHPFIDFAVGSAAKLDQVPFDDRRFDVIIYNDVVYYLPERDRERSLRWIADHLTDDGIALVAGWSPGGKYLEPDEFTELVSRDMAIEEARFLGKTEHMAYITRRRRRYALLTVDYETWQPIPPGRVVDWDADVLRPTAALLDALDAEGAKLTLFAEMGEWIWLRENDPAVAARIEDQLRDALARGHDVQLHLHPNWLPELGARFEDGEWHWDEGCGRAADYPGDLTELIARCKRLLEDTLRPVDPGYEVTSFRAGAYEAQPFRRLHDALVANGIHCDSSVHPGGHEPDRSWDYRMAWSSNQPYFASRFDPQLKAPPSEEAIVELPIVGLPRGRRWTFDASEGRDFAERLIRWDAGRRRRRPSSERLRRRKRFAGAAASSYRMLRPLRPLLNRVLPRRAAWLATDYRGEPAAGDEWFVLVGHSKFDLDVDAIRRGVRVLHEAGFETVTMSDGARRARTALEDAGASASYSDGAGGPERSQRLRGLVPADAQVLDLGQAGAEPLTAHDDASFDCVYANGVLQQVDDVDGTLRELRRVLRPGGLLAAAIWSDARNPEHAHGPHVWKAAPHEVRMRLEEAGFADVEVDEVDAFRRLGMAPFPPAGDRLMHVRARA